MDREIEEFKSKVFESPKITFDKTDLLSCGASVVDVSVSGHVEGAFPVGSFILFVGDSESGKTWIAANTLAEAANNPRFDDYDLYYDDSEGGMLMDCVHYFGKKLSDRLKPPRTDKQGSPLYNETVEDFKETIMRLYKKGRPFILVEDSLDALNTRGALKLSEKQLKAAEKGNNEPQSYGADKAKLLRLAIRENLHRVRKLGAIIIMLAQSTQNIGFGSKFETKTRGGGTAPKFFANVELWTSIKGRIVAEYKGKKVPKGITTQVKIKKNRITGKHGTVDIDIYNDFGVDNTGSIIDYLLAWGHWSKKKGIIDTHEEVTQLQMKRKDLIEFIEAEYLEDELKAVLRKAWRKVQKATRIERKRRYQ